MAQMAVGAYQTACEKSPHKDQIDAWLLEGKSAMQISKELKLTFGESISDKSISKYKKYREEFLNKELQKNPIYQAKMDEINDQINLGIGKVKQVDTLGRLSEIIDQSASMLARVDMDEVKIKNAQDMRFVTQNMLDAIKIYGDTVLKAQRFGAVENDPSLLKPTTINVDVKSTLTDILKGAINSEDGYNIIDRLRAGINHK